MTSSPVATPLDYSDFDVEIETDIVDERDCNDVPERCDIPSRPESRLGFNSATLNTPSSMEDESCDRFVRGSLRPAWQRDIGPTLGITFSEDMDMAQSSISNKSEAFKSSSFPPSPVDDPDLSSESNEGADLEPDSDCSVYEDSDEETEALLLPLPLQPFAPIPFHTPRTLAPEWTAGRPKFSCLPSPLSTRHAVARSFSFHHVPSRHLYRQHGYSRHALLHLKWFWATREDDWADPHDRHHDSKAYGGLSILGLGPSPVRGCTAPNNVSPDNSGQLPPLSIHPRRGDLSALRDPYCMHIDRYFVGLPLWTMAKTLWIFDMHIGMSTRELGAAGEPENKHTVVSSLGPEEEDARSEAESLDTSMSLHFSDDSDTTLVESDSDSENSPSRRRSVTGYDDLSWESAEDQQEEGCSSSCHMFSQHPEKSPSSESRKRPRNGKTQHKTRTYPTSRSLSPDSSCPPWTTSWYRRWDLLLHLVRHDQDNAVMTDIRDNFLPVTTTKTPMFFIGDDDEEMASAESEDEDRDDMEDVLIMVNPLYQSGYRSLHV